MVTLRAEKVARIAADLPPLEVEGPDDADLLVVGWGGTKGTITAALEVARERGHKVAHVHLRHLNPLPRDLGEILQRHPRVLVPELNTGQLALVLRGEYLVDARPFTKINGMPFKVAEIVEAIEKTLAGEAF